MTWLQNLVDYLKEKKLLTVSFLLGTSVLCCIIVIGYNADSIFPPFPPEVDIEAQRKRLSPTCNNYSCIHDWIKRSEDKDLDLSEMECQVNNRSANALNGAMNLYQDGKLDRSFIVGYYSYWSHYYCHTQCGIDGPFRYYFKYLEINMQYAWARTQNVTCGTIDEAYCRWFGYRWIFNVNFAYFSIPSTFILNFINLTTLRQLFLSYPGTAQHLHFAEIITDGLLNIVMGVHEYLYFTAFLDHWRRSCGYYRFSSVYQFAYVSTRFLSFLNQAYLTGLVMERLFALTNPLKYNSISKENMKKRGRKIVYTVLFSSIVLFFPFLWMYTFSPVNIYWEKHSSFWEVIHTKFVALMVGFYTLVGFVPFVMQIVVGILMEKKYKKFIKKRTNNENEKQMRKQERDKQMLLVGTIGLNLVTGIVSALSSFVFSIDITKLLGIGHPWWQLLVVMVNSIFTFLNGNAAVIIHITLVRSYRQAFTQTFIGRIIFRQTAVAAGHQ